MVSRAIEGGVSQRVTKGDFVVIPEGVPHYITEASPHVIFIAIEFPRPARHTCLRRRLEVLAVLGF